MDEACIVRSEIDDGVSDLFGRRGMAVPTNAGQLRSHGMEFRVHSGGLTPNANYNHTLSSSIYQFAFNDLNAPAILAGHLFPANYIPNFTATASYEFDFLRHRLRVAPMLSYESGYPYGNGTMVWEIVNGKPEQVPNDSYVNPGYNYYFLRNPSRPYNAATNPYIANLGTNEGADPNTLRTTPQTLASLQVEEDLSPRVTAILDVVNLFATATPTQFQGNPYLIGPPGYTGGDVYYERAYGAQYCKKCLYTLGNGIPNNDGQAASRAMAIRSCRIRPRSLSDGTLGVDTATVSAMTELRLRRRAGRL